MSGREGRGEGEKYGGPEGHPRPRAPKLTNQSAVRRLLVFIVCGVYSKVGAFELSRSHHTSVDI